MTNDRGMTESELTKLSFAVMADVIRKFGTERTLAFLADEEIAREFLRATFFHVRATLHAGTMQ